MAILYPADDPRGRKAVKLATQALVSGWPHINAYFMPSASRASVVYTTTRVFCTCPAFFYDDRLARAEGRFTRRCFHCLAVELLDRWAGERAAF